MGEIRQCRGCGFGAGAFSRVLDLGMQPLAERDDGNRYPLRVVRCGHCGLVQLSHTVDRAQVFPPGHPYVTGATKALREHFGALAREVAPLLEPQDLVIDIGANDGTFLDALRRVRPQARLLAVEPTGAADLARKKNLPVTQEFWSREVAADILASLGPAKVVVACNVLAHTDDVHGFLDAVARVLAPGGTLITENHDWAAVNDGLQVDTVYHEHLMYYTPATLGRLLEDHGFLIRRLERVPTHGGSFRTYASPAAVGLQTRADAAAVDLNALVAAASEEGPVWGVGAATRATPLIHWAKLGGMLTAVAEVPGHPKIGSRIPGTMIPVVSETGLIGAQPAYALLLCWHIASDVVPKLRAAGYEGKFIVPLPKPVIWHG